MSEPTEALALEGRSSHELAVIAETCLRHLSDRAQAAGANPAPLNGVSMILTHILDQLEPNAPAPEPGPTVYEEDLHPEWGAKTTAPDESAAEAPTDDGGE